MAGIVLVISILLVPSRLFSSWFLFYKWASHCSSRSFPVFCSTFLALKLPSWTGFNRISISESSISWLELLPRLSLLKACSNSRIFLHIRLTLIPIAADIYLMKMVGYHCLSFLGLLFQNLSIWLKICILFYIWTDHSTKVTFVIIPKHNNHLNAADYRTMSESISCSLENKARKSCHRSPFSRP